MVLQFSGEVIQRQRRITLIVRLKPELELHCAERGVTKSLVVQEVRAEYPATQDRTGPRVRAPAMPAKPSPAYRAFEALGLIGCVSDVGPADKAGVRAAVRRRFDDKRAACEDVHATHPHPSPAKQRASR